MEVKLLLFLAAISGFTLVSTDLGCTWDVTPGKASPSIPGSGRQVTVGNLQGCKEACMNQAEFICHSVRYQPSSTTDCILYAEDLFSTADTSVDPNGWTTHKRPRCAGIWFDWTSTEGQPDNAIEIMRPEDKGTGLEDCVAACMRNVSYGGQGVACQFASMSRTDESTCQLWSSGPGNIQYQQPEEFMTFHRPRYYQGSSASTTQVPVQLQNAGSKDPQLFNASLPMPSAGYLIGWQYYYAALVRPCTSYAAIWSNTGNSQSPFRVKDSTQLIPSGRDDNDGAKFQFVPDVIHVSTDDFAGTHIDIEQYKAGETDRKCSGTRVSYSGQSGQEGNSRLDLNYLQNNLVDGFQVDSSVGLTGVTSTPSLKAYIAPYKTISGQPTVSHKNMDIQVEWVPLDDRYIDVAGYRLFCSENADMIGASECGGSLVTGISTTIIPASVSEPQYIAVSVVRNINGEESRDLLLSNSTRFCSAHERKGVRVTENYSRISPGAQVEVEFAVTGLEDDECADRVKLEFRNGSSTMRSGESFLKSATHLLNVTEGVSYSVSGHITLLDGHRIALPPMDPYELTAPPEPDVEIASRTSSSATFSVASIATKMTIDAYVISCRETGSVRQPDGIIAYEESTTFVNINITDSGEGSSPEGTLERLQTQTRYNCTVKGVGHGGEVQSYSAAKSFWTKPNDVIPVWPDSAANVSHTESTIVLSLPEPLESMNGGAVFSELWVKVVKQDKRRRRDASDKIVARLILTASMSTKFTIGNGDPKSINPPLTGGTYTVSVGYRAPSEKEPLSYTVVPGLEALFITGKGPGPGVVVGAVIGSVIVVILVLVIVVLLIRRRKGLSPFKSLGAKTDNAEGKGTPVPKPRGNVDTADNSPPPILPPARGPGSARNVAPPSRPSRRMDSEHNSHPRPANHDVARSIVKPTKTVPPMNSSQTNNRSTNPIPIDNIVEYIADEKKKSVTNAGGGPASFADEFGRLPNIGVSATAMGRNLEHKPKNRFNNIIPFDENRVELPSSAKNPAGYINASKISVNDGPPYKYIATQGPNKNTIPDFWQMVKAVECKVIIMLCNTSENGKAKCEQYWPESRDAPLRFDDTQITMKKEQKCAEFRIRTLIVKTKRGGRYQEMTVELFHFTAWPDHGVPTTAGLLSFRHRVKDMMVAHRTTPTIVHCSAGVGRTGTFIALDMILNQVEDTKEDSPVTTIFVDVLGSVCHLRRQRSSMVQTKEQYAFLYDTVAEAVTAGNTSILCSKFTSVLPRLRKRLKAQLRKMNLATQYHSPALSYIVARRDQNQEKNRCNILAGDNARAKLDDKNFYINAVAVDGYYRKDDFICTQHPLTNTADDFWLMVHEKKPRAIVYFHDPNEKMEFFPPGDSDTRNFGGIKVLLTEKKDDKQNNLRMYMALVTDGKQERRVKLMQWGVFGASPRAVPSTSSATHNGNDSTTLTPDPDQICKLVKDLEPADNDVTSEEFKQPLVVMCRDGTRLCGLFVVATNLYQRLCIEQEVDVVLEVKLARRSRPEFVANIGEFELLYDFINVFLSQFQTYSNFQQLYMNRGGLTSPANDGLYASVNKPTTKK